MGLNNSAMIFAAGDSGGRLGPLESETFTSSLVQLSHRLRAEQAVLLGLLPNARLTPIYRTSAERLERSTLSADHAALAWQAMLEHKLAQIGGTDAPALALPVADAALPGLPGVLLITRAEGEHAFSKADVDAAAEAAHRLTPRLPARGDKSPTCGIVMFDTKLRPLLRGNACPLDTLDAGVRTALLDDAKTRVGRKARQLAARVRFSDAHGAYHNFRVEMRRDLPTAGGSPVLIYTSAPRIAAWSAIDESAFAADPDVQRLIPALKFMISKFASLPGLPQIAQKSKLSPFHFHRQFSALLGISPKHLMLDCQIEHATAQLVRGDVELVDIARSCGFAHQSHFTSRFKQATGLTPTGWRKAMRATAA